MENSYYGGNSLRIFREVTDCEDWIDSNAQKLRYNRLIRGFKLPKNKTLKLDVLTNNELDKLKIYSHEQSKTEKKKIAALLGRQAKDSVTFKILGISYEEVDEVNQYTGNRTKKKQVVAKIDTPYDLQEERNLIIDSMPWRDGTLLDGEYPGIVLGSFRYKTPNSAIEEATEILDLIRPEQVTVGGLQIKLRGEY